MVELQREGSVPAACAAGFFVKYQVTSVTIAFSIIRETEDLTENILLVPNILAAAEPAEPAFNSSHYQYGLNWMHKPNIRCKQLSRSLLQPL